MQEAGAQAEQSWWATGDTPVRMDSYLTYLVDGRSAMIMMCRRFILARQYIYLGNWGMTPEMELVRGKDHRAGEDGSPEQEALLAELRAEGFQEADIQFWQQHNLTVQAVLGYAVSKGVEVRALLWRSTPLFSHYHPEETQRQLEAVGVICILDDSAEGLVHHPVESLHQKITIVDGHYAFVGGVDPLIEFHGEYDRWDTPAHYYTTPLRRTDAGITPHPWHDAHSFLEGPVSADVEYNFRQRWNDVVQRHRMDQSLLIPQHPLPPPLPGGPPIQVARTIPEHTYSFQPLIVRGIAQLYANALHNIQRFVYLENQYFWLHAYIGVDIAFIGRDNPQMEENIRLLGAALERGAFMSIILPDHPNVGRAFTDSGLQLLRAKVPQAVEEGRLQAFSLGTSATIDGKEHYRPIYVHSKVAIVDDLWSTVGSGNLNNRGMRDDTEMNVATLSPQLARNFRLLLQAEHLGLIPADDQLSLIRLYGNHSLSQEVRARCLQLHASLEQAIGDPLLALQTMHARAWDNLQRYKAKQPLIGHLLPYLTHEEAIQEGLPFNEEHGWLEEPEQKESTPGPGH